MTDELVMKDVAAETDPRVAAALQARRPAGVDLGRPPTRWTTSIGDCRRCCPIPDVADQLPPDRSSAAVDRRRQPARRAGCAAWIGAVEVTGLQS